MPLSGYIVVIRQDGVEGPTCEWCSWKCTIGRDPSCDISINLPTVAPVHCSLELLNNGLVQATSQLEDKFSMLINGVPLKGSCILSNACLLTAGDRKFRFFYPSSRKSVHFQREGNPSPAATPTAAGDVISNGQTPQSVTKSLKIATPDSMPKVHPTKKFTPKPASVSPARSPRPVHITPKSTLGTRERYGPVPLRPPPTSPAIQVVRHAPAKSPLKSISSDVSKGRRSNTGTAQVHCISRGRTSSTLRESNNTFIPKSAKKPNEISGRRNLTSQSPRLNTVLLRSPTPRKLLSPRHPNITTKSPATELVPSSVPPFRTAAHASRSPPSNGKNVSQKNSPHSTSRKSSHKVDIHTDPPTLKSTPEFDFKEGLNNDSPSTATKTKYAQYQEFRAADFRRACPATAHHSRRNLKRPATARVSMLTENILTAASKRTKGVSFGPALSPEQFDKCLPPSTPVKKGAIPPIICTPQSLSSPKLRSPTPFVKKITPMCEETPNRTTAAVLLSPSYIPITPNRISGVISQPPTPDTNLLDSVSEYDSILRSAGANPVATAHYSAPVSKSKLTRQTNKANCRHSFTLGSTHFINQYTEQKTLRVPPSTPASAHRYNYNDQRSASKFKLSPPRDSTDNGILSNPTKHGLHISSSSRSPRQRSTRTTPLTTSFTAADLFTSNESISNSSEKMRLSRSSSLLLPVKHSPGNTPNNIQLSTAKTLGVTGVGHYRKTLESAISPRLSGVAGMFEETSEVASPARGVGRPRSSSAPTSGKRSSVNVQNLVQRSASKSPNMAGVRRLLKTPKSAMTPRLSGVAGMFEETSEVASPVRGVGRPRSSSASASGKRSPVSTPKSVQRSVANIPNVTSVRRLLKTPKSATIRRLSSVSKSVKLVSLTGNPARSVGHPRLSSVPFHGKRSFVNIPKSVRLSAAKTPTVSDVRRLLKTPKSTTTPRVSGVFEQFSEVASPARGVGRPRSSSAPSSGKRSLVSTPKSVKRSAANTPNVTGLRRSLKTPKSTTTPRLSGVSSVFEEISEVASPARSVGRPRSSSAPSSGKRSSVKVRNLVQRSVSKTPNMAGVRRLLKTPKSAMTPRLSGLADMFEETSEVASPARGVGRPRSSSALSGEKRSSMGSSRSIPRAAAKTPRFTGVRRLWKTPKIVKSPRLSGVRQVLRSPRVLASPSMNGLRRLLKSPKLCVSPRLSGLADLLPFSPESQRNPAASGIKLIRKTSRRQIAVSSRLVRKRALPSTISSDICDVPPTKTAKDTSLQTVPVRSTRAGSKRPPKSTSNSVALPLTSPTESSRATARQTSRPKPVRAPAVDGVGSPPDKPNKTKVNAIPAATKPKSAQKRTPVKNAPLRVTRQRRALIEVNKSVDKPKEEPSSPTRQGRAVRIKKTSTTKRSVSKTMESNTTTTITRVLDSPVPSVRTNRKRKSVPSAKVQAKKPRSTARTTKKTTASLSSPVHSHVVISPRRTRAANRIRN